jgi:hypothetical protein
VSEIDWRARCEELARRLGRDADDLVELWDERAAIREHDGHQSRADAELLGGERLGPRRAETDVASDRTTAKKIS